MIGPARRMFVVDAFARGPFTGNPAAVVELDQWPADQTLQAVAAQNNLSETAFFIDGESISLRWFTPTVEIDLCGHATLATAHVLSAELGDPRREFSFTTASGALSVGLDGAGYILELPARTKDLRPGPDELRARTLEALGASEADIHLVGSDLIAALPSAEVVESLMPDSSKLVDLGCEMVIATAPGRGEFDVVLRVFAPAVGIAEDPATGAAQCALAPFWCERLGVAEVSCHQASARGGYLHAHWRPQEQRVDVGGCCRTFARAEISI